MPDESGAHGFRDSVADALGTRDLRRLQLAWSVTSVGGWAFFVALAVYAYDAGGATAVGAATLLRMVPAGAAAPLTGLLADRHSRRDVLLGATAGRALVLAILAVAVALDAPLAVVLVLGALFTIIATAHKPAQAALLPVLAETPRQLAASNAVWSALDNAGFLVGALIGGALIATTGVNEAFIATAALFALAIVPVAMIPRDPVPDHRLADAEEPVLRELALGFRTIADHKGLRLVVGVLSVSTLAEGMIDVLVVVVALELLDLGGAGVGWLNACWGVGGVIGGASAIGLMRCGRLAWGLALGGLLAGGPLVAIAVVPEVPTAVLMLTVLGVGYALIEVAGLTLLQRLTSDEVLARAFAVVESSYWATTGLGAMLAPPLIAWLGVEGALIAVGATLPALVGLRWAALARLEAGAVVPEEPFKLLRRLSVFAPLPIGTVENLARGVSEMHVPAGTVVVEEGDTGDRFYAVAEGDLDVRCWLGAYPPVGSGDFFGEIALLRDVPRTATVTARTDAVLYALDRDLFLHALGSQRRSTQAAERLADVRLRRVPVG
jgi:MFS family permease